MGYSLERRKRQIRMAITEMVSPRVFKYEITGSADQIGQMTGVFTWEGVSVYPHPEIPGRSIAASYKGMPKRMLDNILSGDPFYLGLRGKYVALVRRAQQGENALAEINNTMVQDGFAGRIALDYALRDVVGKAVKHIHPKSMAGRIQRLTRNHRGQMMFAGMDPSEILEKPSEDLMPLYGFNPSSNTPSYPITRQPERYRRMPYQLRIIIPAS